MKFYIPMAAVGFALAAGAPVAQAQTVITQDPLVTVPASTVVAQPTEIEKTTTVRTIRPVPSHTARRQEVTTRTVTRQIIGTPTVVARTVPANPQPLYDEVAPAPLANPDNSPMLYDEALPASAAAPVAQDSYSAPIIYRYVYEPDRILVIDPGTGVAVQALPR